MTPPLPAGPSTQKPLLVIESGSIPITQYLRDLAHHSNLIRVMAARDVKLRYRQTMLGPIWVVLLPLMTAAILAFVFGKVAKLPTDGQPVFLFTYAGTMAWSAFHQTVTRSTSSMTANASLVSKIFFPKVILPLTSVVAVIIDFVLSSAVFLVLLVLNDRTPGAAMLLAPLWVLLLLLLGLGLGTLFASLSVRYRDLAQVSPVLLQLLLYASPVAYAASAVPARYQTLYYLNPVASLLDGFRWSALGTPLPSTGHLLYSVAFAVGLFGLGMVVLERKERGFADVI